MRFGVNIVPGGIDRRLNDRNAPVRITYTVPPNKNVSTEEFDFLIYTGPHIHAHKYVADVVQVESSIFSKLESFILSTTLYKSGPVASYSDVKTRAPIMYVAETLESNEKDGMWYTDRNAPLIFGNDKEGSCKKNQIRVGYQFYEHGCKHDKELCDSNRYPPFKEAPKVMSKFKSELAARKVPDVEIIQQFPWPYFHHFKNPEIMRGVPWDLVDMQGKRKTWWLGASASFESVHDVTNYNLMVLKKFLGAEFPHAVA